MGIARLFKYPVRLLGAALCCASVQAQVCKPPDSHLSLPERKLYIVAGQSNAVGLASIRGVRKNRNAPFLDHAIYPNVKIYGVHGAPPGVAGKDDAAVSRNVEWSYFAGWRVASPGFGYKNVADGPHLFPFGTRPGDFFGPELSLARHLNNQPPRDHYIAKLAVGNASLNYSSSADNWMPTSHLYNELLKLIADAHNSKREIVRLRVSGMFFMQGETDALNQAWSRNYEKSLFDFITSIRRDLKHMGCSDHEEFPVVVGRIQDNPVWVHRKYVRAGQQEAALKLPLISVIDTDDFASHLVPDGIHFNEYAQNQLGTRVYRALEELTLQGRARSLVRKDPSRGQFAGGGTNGVEFSEYCCLAASSSSPSLQRFLPRTYTHDGVCQGRMCTSLY